MLRFLQILILVFPFGLNAQFTYVMDQTIAVKDEQGEQLPLSWAGGLNAAHYNTMELNGDGKEDLVLFDRTADKILTFIQADNKYQYAPEYENYFPDEITNWLLLRDYNCDGKKDIFTGDILGIKVYTNVGSATAPEWEQFLFSAGAGGSKSQVLLTKGFSGKINLQLQFDDLPSLTDADGDGDLDIFNLRFVGEGTIEFHKNFSQERYGTCDSLDFERITQKWGGLAECNCGEFAFNDEDCTPIGGRVKHAGGKSLLMLDVDGNSTLDALFSEASCSNLYEFKNEGTTLAPVLNSFSLFPAASPVDFLIFPAAFYEDVDFDGKKDLLSTPNIFSKTPEILNADLKRSNWFYKNTGSNSSPSFVYTTNSFLQDQMIDVGDNAVPAFNDYDGDGDLDLFISNNNNSENGRATIKLYENTGTAASPEFTLANMDMFGFSSNIFYNLKIQFADVDHDSKTDLVFTATSFVNGLTQLYYISNKSNSVLDFSGQTVQPTNFTIFSSENILLADVNNDGFQDLLVGRNNGALEFWKNQGEGTLMFTKEDDTYLELTPSILRQNMSGTSADLDADGKTDLVLTDQTGRIAIINNFREAGDATKEGIRDIVFDPLATVYEEKNLGGRIWPVAVNIFSTNKPALIVGTVMGGISVLRNDDGESLPKDPVVHIYPNPSARGQAVSVKIDRPATVHIYSSLGQELSSSFSVPANEEYKFTMPYHAPGIYILRFTVYGKSFSKRVVIY